MNNFSLIGTGALILTLVLLAAAACAGVWMLRAGLKWVAAPLGVACVALGYGLSIFLPRVEGELGGQRIWVWWISFAVVPFALFAAGIGVFARSMRVGRRWVRWGNAVLTWIVALAGFVGATNQTFSLYPTVGQFLHHSPYVTMSYGKFRGLEASRGKIPVVVPPSGSSIESVYQGDAWRDYGVRVDFPIEPAVSGFRSFGVPKAYLPPAYFTNPRPELPVVVLLNGLPGDPHMWWEFGDLGDIIHRFERKHQGLAPVVVTVDATGGGFDDRGCMDSDIANIQTFLDTDVPAAIKGAFDVATQPSRWAIGGFSYGGTCAFQVVANNPGPYRMFVDLSGDAAPAAGDPQANADKFFHGDRKEYLRHDPLTVVASGRFGDAYPKIAGWFVSGDEEPVKEAAMRQSDRIARAAGMDTAYIQVEGGHEFKTWRRGLSIIWPDLCRRLGLIT